MNYLRFVAATLITIVPGLQSLAQCPLTFKDVTKYSALPETHPFTFTAEGPVGSTVGFHPIPRDPNATAFITQSCTTPNFCTVTFWCPTGEFDVDAWTECDASTGSVGSLPVTPVATDPLIEISGITPLAGGHYRVETVTALQAGQWTPSMIYEVQKKLAPNVYGPPVAMWDVIAAPGDKVGAVLRVCSGAAERMASAYAIIPEAMSIDVAVLDGDGQTAVPGNAAEQPLRVKFTATDPAFNLQSLTAVFEVVSVPAAATGQGVGGNDTVIAQTYAVPVTADGIASAVMVVGNLAGPYIVRVKSPVSVTGSEAKFTTTAVQPAAIVVLKDTTNLAERADAYAASSTEATLFHAVALDAGGAKAGPIKCTWSTSASGNPATRGTGTLNPAAATAATTFRPTKAGRLTVKAASPTKGVDPGVAELFLASMYVSVGPFDPANPIDELPKFIPGSKVGGASVEPAAMPQSVGLHVLTGENTKGSVTFTLTDVSRYPGIAMNYPITSPANTPDFALRDPAGNQTQTATIPFSGSAYTSVTLLALDYGARGKLAVSLESGKTTYQLKTVTLPQDADANGIPDGGWEALANSATGAMHHVSDARPPASDSDNHPIVSGLPSQGITGDGLSVTEEYRGFVVRGAHRRLNPLRKDLFIVISPADEVFDDRVTELPLAIHEIRPGEAAGVYGPVVNPNRGLLPGATPQRALLARVSMDSPNYRLENGRIVRADFEAKGWTFQEGDNINLIDALSASMGLVQSPNETLVAEVFDWAYWRHYISYGPNTLRETNVAPGDTDYPANQAIHGGSDWLQSAPNSADALGDDFQTGAIYTVCGGGPNRPWRTLTADEVILDYRRVFLHEVAHGLDVEHDRLNCSPSIMSDEAATPVVRTLTANDLAQIRIHRKHN
jgi:hypothetical protein